MGETILGFVIMLFILLVFGVKALELALTIRQKLIRMLPVKQIMNESVELLPEIKANGVYEVVTQYFKHANRIKKYKRFVTDVFIREVYYATTQEALKEISVSKMVSRLAKENRSGFKNFQIDEITKINDDLFLVGVTRTFRNKNKNRVNYIVEKINSEWKINHITRHLKGLVKEKFMINDKIGYMIGNEAMVMFFVDKIDRGINEDDFVYVEGYLETSYLYHGNFFYHVVLLNQVQ
ncbi:hypothetical protein [Chengkuizengella axinellae]|uniref:Uncharacterized protein n=1 Tax=Chengkuizengella axinellae TaxID=3064388 RepID=A0ABT9IU57_9BACL|nr:hypothetical protein [Chengkuizengella sp. 2205SS18-9]MDP5272870.1 hypothetical protein [Chengkuizengella sp. 2205SS18-9]